MKEYLSKFSLGTYKNQELDRPAVGALLPPVSVDQPFILPFIGQNKALPSLDMLGMTLIELIVVLSIVAILASIAAPNLSAFVENNRIAAATNDLMADLSFARSEAVKRAANVSLCKLPPNASAPPCSTVGADWAGGRAIFVDANNNGEADAGEVLRIRDGAGPGVTLNTTNSFANLIVFDRAGMIAPSGTTGLFAVCNYHGAPKGRALTILSTGRATITKPPASCAP